MTRELQMSRQEAIDILRCRKDGNAVDALEVLIRLAEAWDEVIKEIEGQRDFNIECDGESDLGMAIQIIKKHLGEVEE
jgi:hypothetical protein